MTWLQVSRRERERERVEDDDEVDGSRHHVRGFSQRSG